MRSKDHVKWHFTWSFDLTFMAEANTSALLYHNFVSINGVIIELLVSHSR